VLSRITENSFEQIEVVDQAFEMSGGVPRELFKILSYANIYRGNLNRISTQDIEFAATKLGSEWSRYLTLEDLSVLKEIDSGEIRQPESAKDEIFNLVGEGILLFDPLGGKLRIAPLIKRSEIFKQPSISYQDQEADDLHPDELGPQTQIFDPSQVNIETRLLSIHHLMKKIEAGEIELDDKIYSNRALSQWSNQKQSSFLESILIKLPIPPIYIDASKPGKWIVIDGVKRLRAIKRFLLEQEHPLRLIRLEFLEDLEGKLFRELDLPTQRALEESNMQVFLISQGTPFNIKFSIYKRLNSSYGDFNSQQIRNLLFNGPATAFLGKLAEVDALKEISSGKLLQYPQMHDREFANRFLAFYLWGFEDYQGNMDAFLNKAMAEIVRLDMPKRSEVISRFEEALHFVKSVLGTPALNQIIWSSYTLPRYLPINKSLVEVLTVCFATQMDHERAVLREKKDWFSAELGELIIIDKEFRIALTASPSNHEMIKYRFLSLYNLIQRALQ
jgi:hypothetical protein